MTQAVAVTNVSQEKVTLVVSHKDIEAYTTAFLMRKAKTLKIPGFRPGKAPLNIVQERYLNECLNDALNFVVEQKTTHFFKENKISFIGEVTHEFEKYEFGQDLTFNITFQVPPSVNLGDYKALQMQRFSFEPSEQEVEAQYVKLMQRVGVSEDAEPNTPIEFGHHVIAVIKARYNKKRVDSLCLDDENLPFKDPSSTKGFNFIKDLMDAFNAHKVGDKFHTSIVIDKDYPIESVAGKKVDFEINFKAHKIPTTKEITFDYLVRDMSEEEIQKTRTTFSTMLKIVIQQQLALYHKRMLLDKLSEVYVFEVPQSFVQNEFNGIWHHLTQELENNGDEGDMSEEELDNLRAEYMAIAERRVRLGMLISSIARTENIRVPEDVVQNLVAQKASEFSGNQKQNMQLIRKNESMMNGILAGAIEDLVIKFLMNQMDEDFVQKTHAELISLFKGVLPGLEEDEEDESAIEDQSPKAEVVEEVAKKSASPKKTAKK